MNDQTGKLLVVESDDALRATLFTVLGDAGYKVSIDYRGGMKAVLAFEPDLVILGADPPHMDCCDLLSDSLSRARYRAEIALRVDHKHRRA
jgi:DNA-binding response OmpR family regulator